MKRRHLREDSIKFCSALKKIRPEITFSADIIAGFPTETAEMFKNTIKAQKNSKKHLETFKNAFTTQKTYV